MHDEGHVFVRVCVFLGAIVIVISSILLEMARADISYVDAMRIAWLGLGAGIALVLCGIENFFLARKTCSVGCGEDP